MRAPASGVIKPLVPGGISREFLNAFVADLEENMELSGVHALFYTGRTIQFVGDICLAWVESA
jgi:hypothetical protein